MISATISVAQVLAEQGYAYQTLEASDHGYRTLITRLAEAT